MAKFNVAANTQHANPVGSYFQGKALRLQEQNNERKMQMQEREMQMQEDRIRQQDEATQAAAMKEVREGISAERKLGITDPEIRGRLRGLAENATTVEGTQAWLGEVQNLEPLTWEHVLKDKWDKNGDGILDEGLRNEVISGDEMMKGIEARGEDGNEIVEAYEVLASAPPGSPEHEAAKLAIAKAKKDSSKADYTIDGTRYSGEDNQPIAGDSEDGPEWGFKPTTKMKELMAAGVEPGSKEWNTRLKGDPTDPVRTQKVDSLVSQGIPQADAEAITDKLVRMSVSPTTGKVTLTDLRDGSAREVEIDSNIPGTVSPETGSGLYDLAEMATGPASAWEAFKANNLAWMGIDFDQRTQYVRQAYQLSTRDYIEAMSLNPRYPISEQQMVLAKSALVPGLFKDAEAMKTDLRALDNDIRRELVNVRDDAQDTGLEAKDRGNAAKAVKDKEAFLRLLAVPSDVRGKMDVAPGLSKEKQDRLNELRKKRDEGTLDGSK